MIRAKNIIRAFRNIDNKLVLKTFNETTIKYFTNPNSTGVGKIKLDLSDVDLISFAPHKFYGLNGFGGLIKKKDIVLEPLINGGASIQH